MHHTSYVDVLLLLVRDEHVLLAERANTGYADGQWNLPSGKLEKGENLLDAILRQAREEIQVELRRAALRMVTSVHNLNPEGDARMASSTHAPGTANRTTPNGPTPRQHRSLQPGRSGAVPPRRAIRVSRLAPARRG